MDHAFVEQLEQRYGLTPKDVVARCVQQDFLTPLNDITYGFSVWINVDSVPSKSYPCSKKPKKLKNPFFQKKKKLLVDATFSFIIAFNELLN